MRYLIPVLLAVVLAAPASAQTLLSATFTPGYAVANDNPNTPYATTARTKGYSNEVGLSTSGTLYFRVLMPDVLGRTIKLDFSNRLPDPTGTTTPCRRFGSVVDDFFCAPPLFLESPGPSPFVTFSWISTMYEWEHKGGRWVRREEPDRRDRLQPVILDFNTPGTWTRYAVLNWQLRFDEGTTDPYAYWLFFSNTWEKGLNPDQRRDGIVAITRRDDSTWVVRPIDSNKGDPGLPEGLVAFQALLTQYVLADPDSCVPGVGAHCYLGDYLLPFELTLKKVPKMR
jgi:hypothetical protein